MENSPLSVQKAEPLKSNFVRLQQVVFCIIQEMCPFSIKYVVQSGRKVVCPLLHWQSGIHPAVGTATRLPALAGQQSGEENCDLDKSHTGWHLSRRLKRNPREYPLCPQVIQLPPPLSM